MLKPSMNASWLTTVMEMLYVNVTRLRNARRAGKMLFLCISVKVLEEEINPSMSRRGTKEMRPLRSVGCHDSDL